MMGRAGKRLVCLVFLSLLPALGWPAAVARAQSWQAQIPLGRELSADQVLAELEFRLRFNPSEATIWNTGYDFFRLYPGNQDTAWAIMQGYLRARRQEQVPEQRDILLKAAVYWEKIHAYGLGNVAVGQDFSQRDNIYWGPAGKQGTLGMRRPEGGPVPYRDNGYHGLNPSPRAPYRGRPDNPWPGSYYQGVYPP